jgi:hypothetical protein
LSFSGTIAPADAGHQVSLQRENASGLGFHTVEEGAVAADASYSITHLFTAGDGGVYRIKVPRGAGLEGCAGEPFTISVTSAPAEPATAAG